MSVEQRTVAGYAGIEQLGPDGIRALSDVADSLGINPDWLGAVMKFESGFVKDVKNKFSGATGYIQFMPSTAGKLGTTTTQIAAMSPSEQIRGPVYQYLVGFKGRMKSLEDTYLAVFFPAAMGKDDSYVVGRRDATGFEKAVYDQNAGFDSGKTGQITRGMIVGTIRAVANAAKSRPRIPIPAPTMLGGGSSGFLVVMLGIAGVTAGLVAWSLKRGL